MGWFLEVSAECGPERQTAEALSEYVSTLILPVSESLTTTCWSEVRQDEEKNWWCIAIPQGANYDTTPRLFSGEEQVKALVETLYSHLQTSPAFRYASIGYESEEFMTFSVLLRDLNQLNLEGLVVNEQLWHQAGQPTNFVPFASGYRWQPLGRRNYCLNA